MRDIKEGRLLQDTARARAALAELAKYQNESFTRHSQFILLAACSLVAASWVLYSSNSSIRLIEGIFGIGVACIAIAGIWQFADMKRHVKCVLPGFPNNEVRLAALRSAVPFIIGCFSLVSALLIFEINARMPPGSKLLGALHETATESVKGRPSTPFFPRSDSCVLDFQALFYNNQRAPAKMCPWSSSEKPFGSD